MEKKQCCGLGCFLHWIFQRRVNTRIGGNRDQLKSLFTDGGKCQSFETGRQEATKEKLLMEGLWATVPGTGNAEGERLPCSLRESLGFIFNRKVPESLSIPPLILKGGLGTICMGRGSLTGWYLVTSLPVFVYRFCEGGGDCLTAGPQASKVG